MKPSVIGCGRDLVAGCLTQFLSTDPEHGGAASRALCLDRRVSASTLCLVGTEDGRFHKQHQPEMEIVQREG